MLIYFNDYGTGAIFACPAHDQRDLDFAQKYDLPVIDTFFSLNGDNEVCDEAFIPPKSESKMGEPFHRFDIATGQEAIDKTIDFAEKRGWGKSVTNYGLRDWD